MSYGPGFVDQSDSNHVLLMGQSFESVGLQFHFDERFQRDDEALGADLKLGPMQYGHCPTGGSTTNSITRRRSTVVGANRSRRDEGVNQMPRLTCS